MYVLDSNQTMLHVRECIKKYRNAFYHKRFLNSKRCCFFHNFELDGFEMVLSPPPPLQKIQLDLQFEYITCPYSLIFFLKGSVVAVDDDEHTEKISIGATHHHRSCFFLKPKSTFRLKLLQIVESDGFDHFIVLVILSNCIILALDDDPPNGSKKCF